MANPGLTREQMAEAAGALAAAGGNQSEAARALGLNRQTFRDRLTKAASAGLVGGPPIPPVAVPPEGFEVSRNSGAYDADGKLLRQWVGTKPAAGPAFEVPAGHAVKGVSVLTNARGEELQRWVKTRETGAGDVLVDALKAAFADTRPAPVIPAPSVTDADTLTVYPLADLHFGMHAWHRETGANYDARIAAEIARDGIADLVAQSRPSKRAVLLNLGDFFHQNDQRNATPASGHQLDVDGRWARVFERGAALMVDLVDLLARKHDTVDVVCIPGNHDADAAVTLRVALGLFYRDNPRIAVHMEPGLHWYKRFGKVLLGASHGHTMKPDRMAMMLATDRARDWGETEHRHFFFGHVHHESAKEVGPVRVESFSTPAARDAYAQGGGYRSGRALNAITFHAERGEIGRHRVNIGAPVPGKAAA